MTEASGARLGRVETELPRARDAVITGMGMISPLGGNVDSSWDRLIRGKSGLSSATHKYVSASVFGAVNGFDAESTLGSLMTGKELKRVPRVAQFSTAASFEALAQAGLLNEDLRLKAEIDAERIGVVIGSGFGPAANITEIDRLLREKEGKVTPNEIFNTLVERVSTIPSMVFGLQGPLLTPSAACATGNVSIITGIEKIALGQADIMLVGGSEASLTHASIKAFDALHALSKESDPNKASRPFDMARDGFVYGEGAGVLVIESYESAVRRGVNILAYLGGYGQLSDANHPTDPDGRMQIRTIEKATRDLIFPKSGTIYVNAHGTATPTGDPIELISTRQAIADKANTLVSSTKGATGHTLGAAAAIEAIFCIKALHAGLVPPTVHNDNPIEEANGVDLVRNKVRMSDLKIAINLAFGFGGINTAIWLSLNSMHDQR